MVNRKARLVGLVTIILIVLFVLFVINKMISYVNRPKEKVQNIEVKNDGFNLNINGNYLTYVEVNDDYNDEGAKASINGQDISDDVITSYYKDGRQVSAIDTRQVGTYIVRYDVRSGDKTKDVTRVVLVIDGKAPHLTVPDTVTITSDEAVNYDVENGVMVTDNAGEASFECKNTLSSVPGDYVISCTAKDSNGNKTTRNRLIRVINGIEFEYKDKLIIKYPVNSKKNYTYKYSLDNGITWLNASSEEVLNVKSGNVIALVLENDKYIMSSTYYIK